ncbi:hypothetical protein HYT58_02745 [Candidatus Woesearchaeota archaeon]|nr:hypothetical protein [Candidatus Woesearchaeota archaeon]
MLKKLIFLLMFLISLQVVIAATIHGSVYSPYLEKLTNSVVEINTNPKQTMVAKTGNYSFNVPPGSYILEAGYKNREAYSTNEQVVVDKEGTYVLDLILEPDFSETDGINPDVDIPRVDKQSPNYKVFFIPIIILALIYLLWWWDKKHIKHKEQKTEQESQETEESPDLNKIIEFIKKHGNRITQRDIRKEFPVSEAKISLMLAELESKGKIQKIKKGRGNIIILKP